MLHLSEQQINPFLRSSYLVKAEKLLRNEMRNRGFVVNYVLDLSSWPEIAMNDWIPNEDEIEINRMRIKERLG